MSESIEEVVYGPPRLRMYPDAFWLNVRLIAPYIGPLSLALFLYIWLNCERPWGHPWLEVLQRLLLFFPFVFLFFDRRSHCISCPQCRRLLDSPGIKDLPRGEYPLFLCTQCNVVWRTGESRIRYTGGGWGPRESPEEVAGSAVGLQRRIRGEATIEPGGQRCSPP